MKTIMSIVILSILIIESKKRIKD